MITNKYQRYESNWAHPTHHRNRKFWTKKAEWKSIFSLLMKQSYTSKLRLSTALLVTTKSWKKWTEEFFLGRLLSFLSQSIVPDNLTEKAYSLQVILKTGPDSSLWKILTLTPEFPRAAKWSKAKDVGLRSNMLTMMSHSWDSSVQ